MKAAAIHIRLIVVTTIVIFSTTITQGNTISVLDQMTQVIQNRTNLTTERQRRLVAVLTANLATGKNLGSDKTYHATEHMSRYLDDILSSNSRLDDNQFQVVVDTLQWNIHNYIVLPPIDEATRTLSQNRIKDLADGVSQFIQHSYTDTPPDVREELIKRQSSMISDMALKAGNYFYAEALYPSSTRITSDSVSAQLAQAPFMGDNAKKYAPVAIIMADETLPLKSRQTHIGFFVNNECGTIRNAVTMISMALFDLSQHGAATVYVQPPPELMEEYKQIMLAMQAKSEQEIAALPKKAERERFVRQVLQGTGITVSNGSVNIPNQIPNLAGAPPEALNGAADHPLSPPTIVAVNDAGKGVPKEYLGMALVIGLVLIWALRWRFRINVK